MSKGNHMATFLRTKPFFAAAPSALGWKIIDFSKELVKSLLEMEEKLDFVFQTVTVQTKT